MGVTADGNVVTLKTEKSGSLDPESVFEMMQVGIWVIKMLRIYVKMCELAFIK